MASSPPSTRSTTASTPTTSRATTSARPTRKRSPRATAPRRTPARRRDGRRRTRRRRRVPTRRRRARGGADAPTSRPRPSDAADVPDVTSEGDDDADRVAGSGEIPAPGDIRLKAARARADHSEGPERISEGSRGVESSNVDGRRGHRARARRRDRRVHVRLGRRQARPGQRVVRRARTSPTRTSPRARPVPRWCRPGSITKEKVAQGLGAAVGDHRASNELNGKVPSGPIDTKQFITAGTFVSAEDGLGGVFANQIATRQPRRGHRDRRRRPWCRQPDRAR